MRVALTGTLILGGFFLGTGLSHLDQQNRELTALREQLAIAHQKNTQLTSSFHEADFLATKNRKLLEIIFSHPMDNYLVLSTPVTVSAYTASVDETNSEPHFTADMTPSRIGLVAISRDLEHELGISLGQTIILPSLGVFRVHDRMSTHKRKNTASPVPITRSIDILHANKKAAKKFGVRQNETMLYIQPL